MKTLLRKNLKSAVKVVLYIVYQTGTSVNPQVDLPNLISGTEIASPQLKQRPLWIKCIGERGDLKQETLMSAVYNQDLLPKKLENIAKSLKMEIINRKMGFQNDMIFVPSEILDCIQILMEKTRKSIEGYLTNIEENKHEVIFEFHCLEEILLYSPTYFSLNKITDFIFSLILSKFNSKTGLITKMQEDHEVLYLYFIDDA